MTTNIYESINARITGLLNDKLKGYEKTWFSVKVEPSARNPYTNHYYAMINNVLLHMGLIVRHGYYLNRWITFLQAKQLGAKIRKGSYSETIVFTSSIYLDGDDKNVSKTARAIADAGGQLPDGWRQIPFLKGFNVFNVADVEGLPADWTTPEKIEFNNSQRIAKIDEIIRQTGAVINETNTNQPCYYPGRDQIFMPMRWQFDSGDTFYSVLFHELGHWTGHETRLNRKLTPKQEDYAFEELVAELTAAYCCARLNLAGEITNNAAYIKGWLKGLENDMKFFTLAASLAQKAVNYIFGEAAENAERSAA